MSFLLKDTIHTSLAETVYNEFLSRRSNYHYFIGKVLDWESVNTPDTPASTQEYEYNTRNDIISVKKINTRDVSLVVPRVDWETGTIYDTFDGNYSDTDTSYSGADSIKDSNFYVLTSSYGVYKCIFNNNDSESTSEPEGTDLAPVEYEDGYIWKYLYTIPLSLRNKFLTTEYMPVVKSVLTPFYSDGQIDSVVIDSAGSGYTGNALVSLVVHGTFGAGNGNSIANLTPVISNTGQIVDVLIVDRGNNYTSANIQIVNNGVTGTGYYNTSATANVYPILYNKQIDRVLIDDPGINYDPNTETTITLTGDGTGAELTPYINEAGEVEDIVITNRGNGYTYLNIAIAGEGTGANAYAQLSTGDLNTLQSFVELSSIPGSIYSFRVHDGGEDYSYANVTVSGDGSSFFGDVVLVNNAVSYVTVTSPGSGYTYANVVITGDGTGANVSAILSPYHGHGFNPVKELFADTLMFYTTLSDEKVQGIPVTNDYRQFGIVKDIKEPDTEVRYDGLLGSPCFLVTLASLGSLAVDDVLTVSGAETRYFDVVGIKSSTNQVLLSSKTNYTPTTNTILIGEDQVGYNITSIDESPTINKFSGDLLYINNTTKVSNNDNQIVTLRTVIRL